MFIKEVEVELRRQKRLAEVDIVFELCEELQIYPSKYQRPNMLLQGLRAQTTWTVEESGYQVELESIISKWDRIRAELMNLTDQLEDWEWKSSPVHDKLDYFYFIGDGVLELPGHGCEIATTFCDTVKHFSLIRDCALCEMKLVYFEPQGHYLPHVGPTNAK